MSHLVAKTCFVGKSPIIDPVLPPRMSEKSFPFLRDNVLNDHCPPLRAYSLLIAIFLGNPTVRI